MVVEGRRTAWFHFGWVLRPPKVNLSVDQERSGEFKDYHVSHVFLAEAQVSSGRSGSPSADCLVLTAETGGRLGQVID